MTKKKKREIEIGLGNLLRVLVGVTSVAWVKTELVKIARENWAARKKAA
jgi:hypothetical protein